MVVVVVAAVAVAAGEVEVVVAVAAEAEVAVADRAGKAARATRLRGRNMSRSVLHPRAIGEPGKGLAARAALAEAKRQRAGPSGRAGVEECEI